MRTLLILSVALLAACGGDAPKTPTAVEEPPVSVSTAAIEMTAWPSTYEATGTVRARVEAAVASRVMGIVEEVTVNAGDSVRAGQLLVRVDARSLSEEERRAEAAIAEAKSAFPELENAVAAARAQQDLAEVTMRRMRDLFEKKSVSNQEYDEAAARLRVAQANVRMAEARRGQIDARIQQAEAALASARVVKSDAEIRAPFAGVVTSRLVEPGNMANPGAPLLMIEQAGAYRLEANVEESRLPQVRRGHKVAVSLDALDREMEGTVTEIQPSVDAAARTFIVKIVLPSAPQLRSGLFGRARFALGTREVLTAPEGALVERGQMRQIFVAQDGRARLRLVTAGARREGRVEILSGASASERAIVPVPAGLTDGRRIEVRP